MSSGPGIDVTLRWELSARLESTNTGQNSSAGAGFIPSASLARFGPACSMDTLVRAAQTTVFADLAPAEREHAFMLIQRCPENEPRRLAANVRNFYTVQAYGAIQEPLTGVKINLYAPSDWIERNRPALPPTRFITPNSDGMEGVGRTGTAPEFKPSPPALRNAFL